MCLMEGFFDYFGLSIVVLFKFSYDYYFGLVGVLGLVDGCYIVLV